MNRRWTEMDLQFIRENAGKMLDQELADWFTAKRGRPVSLLAIRKMRKKLGIFKAFGRGVCKVVPPLGRRPRIEPLRDRVRSAEFDEFYKQL